MSDDEDMGPRSDHQIITDLARELADARRELAATQRAFLVLGQERDEARKDRASIAAWLKAREAYFDTCAGQAVDYHGRI